MTIQPTVAASAADLAQLLDQLHAMDALTLARMLPDASIDMVFTDPPYSSGGLHTSARTRPPSEKYINSDTKAAYVDFESDNMDQRAWAFWCHAWLSECRRALKPGGLLVCFIDWRQLPTLTDVVQAAGLILRGVAVWDKTPGRTRPRRGGFAQQAEFIVWASRGALRDGDVYLPGVFPVRLPLPKQHVTEKPLDIAREVVRLVPVGGVVCDLFAGSGTFLAAAREAGRHWIGCETNAAYHAIASARLDAAADDSAVQVAQQLN
ncbi:DNA-methyltransferase [Burkholderia pseudomallei]|uniref:DNA-methyltransferase n=1 Tax=Burkholderia pseudomallei TaxID=28450 RepID=UPI001561801C|nr:site-specific DNA-methyltransferase [Burkholderia pseudomallei]NRE46959.1 site-specific DNA-methyltransferase [Burkholderia pseudomallei]